MDFEFTSEQNQLADAVRRFVERSYDFETRKRIVRSASGTDDAVWAQLVELGLTALPMPEEHGGFGGGAIDLLPVMQEAGRGMLAEPLFATLFAAKLIARASNQAHRALLDEVAAGSIKLAAALTEADTRYALTEPALAAVAQDGGHVLDGRKVAVPYGAQADRLVVSARLDGKPALFVVDANGPGIARRDARVLDGQRVAQITFDHARVGPDALLASGDEAVALIDAVSDEGVAWLCAEAVGVIDALSAATLDYAKTRKQFGQPIARFQVLQHRMVDMFIHAEQARSMAYLAAATVDRTDVDANERRRVVSAAKVRVGQAARFVGQQAVQIHGGMGVTDELPAAHLFKRLTTIELTLGDTDHHLQRFIAASAARPERAAVDAESVVEAPWQRAA